MGKRGIVEDIKSKYIKAKKKNKYTPFIVMGIFAAVIVGGLYFGTDMFKDTPSQTYMLYGIYSDGTYGALGTTDNEGKLSKTLSIDELSIYNPDNAKKLDGFLLIAYVDFGKTFGDYGGTYLLYNYYVDKGVVRLYERPWVTNSQFIKDPGFFSNPPDVLGANVVKVDNLYWWKLTPSASSRIVALQDQLPPTRAYPVTYNGVTGNPIIFWIDHINAEQSYSNQLKLPVGETSTSNPQIYTITLNMHIYGSSGRIHSQSAVSTMRLSRDATNPQQLSVVFYSPYIYR
jgi:hypothetical protein